MAVWVIVAIALMACFPIVVGLVERRLVWAYEPTGADPPPTPKMKGTAKRVESKGFRRLGAFRHAKARHFKVRYEFWLAPERDVLVVIGGGRAAAVPVDARWVITLLEDGRCVQTVDDPAGHEPDMTGLLDSKIRPRAELDELIEFHRRRARSAGSAIRPFSSADPVADYRDLKHRIAHRLVEQDAARIVGDHQDTWRYTPKGAVLAVLRTYAAILTQRK